jgi:hypothetical protein
VFAWTDLLGTASLSVLGRGFDTGEGDGDGRRRTGARGERLRRGDNLARLELGGDALRTGAGERLRGGERDLARLGPRLRLLSLLGLYDLSRGSAKGETGLLSGLLGDSLLGENSRLDLLSSEIDRFRARCAAGL